MENTIRFFFKLIAVGFIIFAISLINADKMSTGKANPILQKADILNRVWAKPDITNISDMFEPAPERTEPTLFITIHHDGILHEPNKPMPIAEIKAYHLEKFGNFAYHFYVLPTGKIYQTQLATARLPHALGYNNNAVAICLHGNFNLQHPTVAQWQYTARLADELQMQFPGAKIVLHRDLNASTDCAGANFTLQKLQEYQQTKHFFIYGTGN